MAIAALLRSVATKMARAPPRLPSALENQTSSGGIYLSRFSTSTGSTPPSANPRGPQTHNKGVPSDSGWYRVLVAFNKSLDLAIWSMMFGGFSCIYSFIREPDRKDAERAALPTMREEVKKSHERQPAILFANKESQIEAIDVSEGQKITGKCSSPFAEW